MTREKPVQIIHTTHQLPIKVFSKKVLFRIVIVEKILFLLVLQHLIQDKNWDYAF